MPWMPDASVFAVIAQFDLKPGKREDFLAIARDDARHSVAEETGCLQFDICTTDEEPNLVTFYEVYTSRAAFDAHLQTPHLRRFQLNFPALIARERRVRFLACEHTHQELTHVGD